MRTIAGLLAVALLHCIGRLPQSWMRRIGGSLLPLYLPFRRRTVRKLRRLPIPVALLAYYRMRLRLTLLSLRHLLNKPDGCTVEVIGGDLYRAALASGKPVVLLGWHQGPVELLHKIPANDLTGDGRRETGDGSVPQRAELLKSLTAMQRKDLVDSAETPVSSLPSPVLHILTASAFSPALARWMARRRARPGVTVVPPGSMAPLREWERTRGVLAVMVDQVPGSPEDWLSLWNGRVETPYPVRLIEWIRERDAVLLAVSVQWHPGNRITFRYNPVDTGNIKRSLKQLMESALTAAPEQYNWSYGKVSVQ